MCRHSVLFSNYVTLVINYVIRWMILSLLAVQGRYKLDGKLCIRDGKNAAFISLLSFADKNYVNMNRLRHVIPPFMRKS